VLIALILGLAAAGATFAGGGFALRRYDKLHLILGFSAGAVMGVALFDLLPEAVDLSTKRYSIATVTAVVAIGFFLFMLLSRVVLLHPEGGEAHDSALEAGTLCVHSFLDGMGIGLAFKVSTSVGAIVAAAVLAHDFSDGINTVGVVLKDRTKHRRALRWLILDALAPVIGVAATALFTLQAQTLGLVLALFCGFFLYIGASDLLPESHHRHPKALTGVMNVLGALVVFLAIRFAS
jgi:ZIP family zinc transporter